jgi:ankyrin repeat protein
MNSRLWSIVTILLLFTSADLVGQSAQDRLWDASMSGDVAAIQQAVADGAALDKIDFRTSRNGRLALNWAAWYNHVPAIEALLELGAPLEAENITGYSALHHAAESGSFEGAVALLAAGADPNHANGEGRIPSWTARNRGNPEIGELIENAMEAAADPDGN